MNSEEKNGRQNLCRLCLGVADSQMSVFTNGFPKMIKIISSLQIDPLDDLPKTVCLKCTKQVKAAVLLKKRILWSDRYLKVQLRKLLEEQNYNFESNSNSSSNIEEILIITEPDDNEIKDEYVNCHINENENTDSNFIETVREEIKEYGYRDKAQIGESKASNSPKETSISLRTCRPTEKMLKTLETNKLPQNCPVCKKEYSNISLLKMHLRTHDGPVDCPFCGKSYKYRDCMKQHILYCHKSEGKPIVCHICGKTYKRRAVYNSHLKSHLNKKDAECSICGKKFYSSVLLRRHVKQVHEKIKPHGCQYCSKSFPRKDQLTTHLRFHSEETPFSCEICNQKFRHKVSLKNHLRNVHKIQATAVVFCSKCNKGFSDEPALTSHFSKAHEVEKCAFCFKVFATEEFLLKHIQELHLEMA